MTEMHTPQIEAAFKASVALIKHHSKSFYQGFKLLPHDKFLAVASLYAFFRTADDLADEAQQDNREAHRAQLQGLKEDVLAIYDKQAIHNTYTWWPAFAHTIQHYQVPPQGFLMQIAGQVSDLDFQDIASIDELIAYARNVAGSVGRIMLPILASDPNVRNNEHIIEACERLGIAMQITNILRDVGEDLRLRDRVYLPQSLLKQHQLTKAKLKTFINSKMPHPDFDAFIQVWESLAQLAEDHYSHFYQYLRYLDKDAQLPVYGSSLVYKAIMDEVRHHHYNCLTAKQYVSTDKKLHLLKEAKDGIGEVVGRR